MRPFILPDRGGQRLLTSGTISAAATLDLVLTGYTSFRGFKLVLSNLIPATDDADLWLRTSTNGGTAYDSGTSDYSYKLGIRYLGDEGVWGGVKSTGAAQIVVADSVSNAAYGGLTVELDCFDIGNAAVSAKFMWRSVWEVSFNGVIGADGHGARYTTADVDALRVMFSSGNITSGKYALYGYA